MRAWIFTGGVVYPDLIDERPEEGDLIVTADAGWQTAAAMGLTPDVAVGDFDTAPLPRELAETVECRKFPPEKNATDTQLAVEAALDRGAREIVIIGGLEGRLDHTLSTVAILEDLRRKKVPAVIISGKNRVRFVKDDGVILTRSGYSYFSVIAVSERVKGVSMEGCKYPLKKGKIERTRQWAVSNEIVGNCALIEIGKGSVLVIESRD